MRRLVSVAWAVLALTVSAPARAAENADWLSYGHDNQLTNSVSSLALTQKSAPRLHREWLTKLDGAVYATVEELVIRIGAPFVPIKHEDVIYVRPPVG